MERTLAELWAGVLDRPRVEAGDDFFLLGGDSLSWNTLIAAIESELKIELPLEDFLRRSTVRELADWLERAPKTRAAPEKLDSGISDSLASITDRGSDLELEQGHGKKEKAEPFTGIQDAVRAGGIEGRQDLG
jgi:acyl carrier protein